MLQCVVCLCWREKEKKHFMSYFCRRGLTTGRSWMRSVDQSNLSQISVNALSARYLILFGMTFNMSRIKYIIYILRWMHYTSRDLAFAANVFKCWSTLLMKSVFAWWHLPSCSRWNKHVCVKLSHWKRSSLSFFFFYQMCSYSNAGPLTSPSCLLLKVSPPPSTPFPPSLFWFPSGWNKNMVSHYQPDSSLSLTGGVSPPSLLCGELGSER